MLSHLGSGAEIGLAGLEASLAGDAAPGSDFNHGVWDRWNAMTPEDQAEDFVKSNEALVVAYEALDEQTRQDLKVKLFLPEPVDVATAAGFRLNEFTLHSWDVEVAGRPAGRARRRCGGRPARRRAVHVRLARQAKDVLAGRSELVAVHTSSPARDFGLEITDKVALTDRPATAGSTLQIPTESWLRLVAGRLAPAHTPAGVSVTGAVTLRSAAADLPGVLSPGVRV